LTRVNLGAISETEDGYLRRQFEEDDLARIREGRPQLFIEGWRYSLGQIVVSVSSEAMAKRFEKEFMTLFKPG